MGREQGDELPANPAVFVRVDESGERQEQTAYSPTDEVNLAARGWTRKNESAAGRRTPTAKPVTE